MTNLMFSVLLLHDVHRDDCDCGDCSMCGGGGGENDEEAKNSEPEETPKVIFHRPETRKGRKEETKGE